MTENKDDTNTSEESSKAEGSDARQFLTFCVGDEEYGVELMTVREIRGWVPTTQLPNSLKFMKGVIDLRGIVIPIFDLRHRFDMGKTEPNEKNVVIIIAIGERLIGILVDAVSDILNVAASQIKPAPQVDSKIDADFVNGLISIEGKMVVVLNIENLFDTDTLAKAVEAGKEEASKNKEEAEKTEKVGEAEEAELTEMAQSSNKE